jgi:hypothetical protein
MLLKYGIDKVIKSWTKDSNGVLSNKVRYINLLDDVKKL